LVKKIRTDLILIIKSLVNGIIDIGISADLSKKLPEETSGSPGLKTCSFDVTAIRGLVYFESIAGIVRRHFDIRQLLG
jgi:hypothetical protein